VAAVPGGNTRSIVSAAAVLTVVALTASCTGSSSSAGRAPGSRGPTSSASAAPTLPDTLAEDASVDLSGSATVTVGDSAPVRLASTKGQPIGLELHTDGTGSIALSMHGSGGDIVAIEGPARSHWSSPAVHVTVLLASSGMLVDTASGNPCTTSYDVVTEAAVTGTVRCQAVDGRAKVPVVVRFRAA